MLFFTCSSVSVSSSNISPRKTVTVPSRPVLSWLRCEQIPQAEDRYDLYLENESWEKAAEVAARLKDPR